MAIDNASLSPNLSRRMAAAKPVAASDGGVIVTQNRRASEVGLDVLRRGGNAVDAAVAASFAVGVVEPWMSGIGGVGAMLVRPAGSQEVTAVNFGPRAPRRLEPSHFPVVGGADEDLFGWPKVEGNRNIVGASAVAVPAVPAGIWAAHRRFGTRPWHELVGPAAELAEEGLQVDWWTLIEISSTFADLARDPGCRALFLPAGVPPVPPAVASGLPPVRLRNEALARSLRQIADEGAKGFYEGRIARALASSVAAAGGYLAEDDLASVEPLVTPAATLDYRSHRVNVVPLLNGGPTLLEAMTTLAGNWRAKGARPDGAALAAYVDALQPAWRRRLTELGDVSPTETSTTHLAVIDRQGNTVSLTQTLLSIFGSRFLEPETGILLNNGINWFDPRPGRPNSMAPGKRGLANYTPTILTGPDDVVALGGSGGRKIMPAVFNLASFIVDYGMSTEEAMSAPRLNVSGPEEVVLDRAFPEDVVAALAARHEVTLADRTCYPLNFTVGAIARRQGRRNEAVAELWHPTAEALGE
ncbi:MAG: gamma-glutamyltransferase family protein [Hyphomicrobiaceae bacterium]